MGKHAVFIWGSYGAAALVLGGMAFGSLWQLWRGEKRVRELRKREERG